MMILGIWLGAHLGGAAGSPIVPGIITAGAGSFVFSGDTMTPVVDYKLPAGAGSFAFTGQDASLINGRFISAAAGSFAFTGADVTLTIGSGAPTTTMDATFASGSPNSLSNGDLTVTGNGSFGCARSLATHSTGKYYWEVTFGTVTNTIMGICTPSQNKLHFLGQSAEGNGVAQGASAWWTTSSISGSSPGPVASKTFAYAMDLTARLIWVKNVTDGGDWNLSGSANPATGAGGLTMGGNFASGNIHAAIACNNNGNSATFNFGGSVYAGSVPSGFGNM